MGENAFKQTAGTAVKEKRNVFAKRTIIEIVLATALIGITSYFIYYKITATAETDNGNSCQEPVCFESFLEITSFIDPSVDPCKNFHGFVCGNFLKHAFAQHVTNPKFLEEERMEYEIIGTIVEPIMKDDSQLVKLQKAFFQSCLDLTAIEADEDVTFFNLIEKIGGWPVQKQEQWQEEKFDWITMLIKCKDFGLPFQWFLNFDLYLQEGINILQITYPYISNYTNQAYRIFMGDIAFALTGSHSRVNVEMDLVLQFERKLVNLTRRNSSEVSVHVHTIEQLQEWHPQYNWIEFFNNITGEKCEFSNDTEVATNIKTYITELDNLLISTPKRTQANYIVWKIIEYFAPYLGTQIRDKYLKVTQMEDLSRLEFCIGSTRLHFQHIAETVYIRKHADARTRKTAKTIVNSIIVEFTKRMKKSFWMKNEVAEEYLKQFKATEIDVGSRDELLDEATFDENFLHIGDLSFDSDNITIVQMISARKRSHSESMFGALGKRGLDKEKNQLQFLPGMDLHYDRTQNILTVPASALHGFLFDKDRPKSLNYGSLGSLVGQEIVAKFVKQLEENDAVKDIWRHGDYKVYENGTKCFEDDYTSNFQDESSLNATEVIQQAISDIIGRDIAYTAYQKWTTSDKEQVDLLLPYSPNQLFWIKSSLINCHKQLIDQEEDESEYVIPKFKNIISLRHSNNFANDFNCPLKSFMNPIRKCWSFL